MEVCVPRLPWNNAKVAKFADPPDLLFRTVYFKTFLFVSENDDFMYGKAVW